MLPSKLRSGQNFKTATVQTINQIIDYLHTQRIVGDNKTIKVTQMTAGVGLSVIQNTAGNAVSGNADLNHPFKLSIGTDQNENKTLQIHKGRIALTGDDQSRIYVCFQPNEEDYLQSVPLPDQAGDYHVELFIFYDEENPSENQDFWQIRILYVPVETMTNQMLNTSGIYSIIIGDIAVTEDEETGDLSYRISSQRLLSDIAMYDNKITQNFRAYFALSEYPENGDVLDQSLVPDTLTIQAGYIYNGADKYYCNKRSFTLTDDSFDEYGEYSYCACLYLNSKLANFAKIEDATFRYFDERNKMYCIPICKIFSGVSIASLEQYVDNAILIDQNDGKVLLNQNDEKRDYLESKIVYPVEIQSALSEVESAAFNPEKPYIKGITYSSVTSTGSGSNAVEITSLYDRIYWDYVSISGFDASSGTDSTVNIQQINNENGQLKWDKSYMVRVTDADNDPDFLDAKIQPGQLIYKAVDNNKLKIWTRGILEGYNIHCSSGYLNDNPQQPYTRIDGHKAVVIEGSGINIDVTTTDSGFTKTYQVKFNPDVLANLIVSTDDSIGVTWSSTNHQFNLKDKGKIRVNANDVIGYLPSKLDSDNDSIIINPQNSYVSLEINPDYFYSELDSISIIERNDGLAFDINTNFFQSSDDSIDINVSSGVDYIDFKATGKVRCNAFDDLNYLDAKINIDSSIASLIRLIKNAGEIKIANALQGTGILFVQNGTITVIPAPAGNAVLASQNGQLTWVPYADCDFACEGSSSASE